MRTLIIFAIAIPVIAYLFYFANKKNKESGPRMQQCQEECVAQGYEGYEFKWGVFGGPQCSCF